MSAEKRYYCPQCKSTGATPGGVVNIEPREESSRGVKFGRGPVLCSILPDGSICCSHIKRGTLLEEMPPTANVPAYTPDPQPAVPAALVSGPNWFALYLANDKAARKQAPLARGLFGYFPNACLHVAHVSFVANEQHNPGLDLQWAFNKSSDEPDCELRHMLDAAGAPFDDDGLLHRAKKAWRALADLERYVLSTYSQARPGASVTGFNADGMGL